MMSNINTILIDDEQSALRALSGMLTKFCPKVNILSKVTSIEAALVAIEKYNPNLIFLDIEIPPEGKGFDLLGLLPQQNFGVIFTTAYPEYALQAINDAQPWGYIIKPYRVSDLIKVVNVAREKIIPQLLDLNHAQDREEQTLLVSDRRKGKVVVHFKDILYCKADHHNTDIFYIVENQTKRITTSQTLKRLETKFPQNQFCRCHHSFIVNMQHIVRYQRTGRNGIIFLYQEVQVPISVLKMDVFENCFLQMLNGV